MNVANYMCNVTHPQHMPQNLALRGGVQDSMCILVGSKIPGVLWYLVGCWVMPGMGDGKVCKTILLAAIIIIIIIIIVHLRTQPEGYGAAIYIFWAPGPYRISVSPVPSFAVLRGPPLLSLDLSPAFDKKVVSRLFLTAPTPPALGQARMAEWLAAFRLQLYARRSWVRIPASPT